MAFRDYRLPDSVEKGAEGGPRFNTNLITLENGAEKANVQWKGSRGAWSVSYGVAGKEDWQEVINAFFVMQGRAHCFRFRDWSDYVFQDDVQFIGDGVKQTFQLLRSYLIGTTEFLRPIYLPIIGEDDYTDTPFEIFLDGVKTLAYSVGLFGEITLNTPPAVGVVVTVRGEFDIIVRFDTDQLTINVQTPYAAAVNTFTLLEKRPPDA